MRCPALLPQGVIWNAGVSLVDLMPTILEATNVNAFSPVLASLTGSGGPALHGRSLLPEIRSKRDEWTRAIVIENVSEKPLKGSLWDERAIRFGRWKLITRLFETDSDLRADELYDLDSDPEERRNVLNEPSSRAAARQLAERLAQWAKETRDPVAEKLAARVAA
jgi:arylsulfatase A-like enzyme